MNEDAKDTERDGLKPNELKLLEQLRLIRICLTVSILMLASATLTD